MTDGWEVDNNLDPLVDDTGQDPDSDGFTNLEEFSAGTDPWDPASFPSYIPTLNEWGLILLVLLMSAVAVVSQRRGHADNQR